jgi:hypothetical protein
VLDGDITEGLQDVGADLVAPADVRLLVGGRLGGRLASRTCFTNKPWTRAFDLVFESVCALTSN